MTLYHPTQRRAVVPGIGDVACPAGYSIYGPTGVCTQDPAYRLQATLEQYLQAAALGQYGDPPPTPDQMASMLGGEIANMCAQSFIPCDASVQQMAQGYVQGYAQWYAGYTPGTLVYAQPPQPPPPAPNTLNNVAPVPVYVPPQPVGTVLNPPNTTGPGVNPGTITGNQSPPPPAAGTTQNTTVVNASGNWFTDKTTLGSVEIPNYLLVGGAGLALLLVVGSKG